MNNNIVDYIDKFTVPEKVILLHAVNDQGNEISLATLPFVNRKVVCKALVIRMSKLTASTADHKKCKSLLSKLGVGHNKTDTFLIRLNDKKVYKHSQGDSPIGRVMRLPSKKVAEAGIQWNAFRRKWVQPEVVLYNQVVLSRNKDGFWLVECDAKIVNSVRDQLTAFYGVTDEVIHEGMLALYKKAKRR